MGPARDEEGLWGVLGTEGAVVFVETEVVLDEGPAVAVMASVGTNTLIIS
jgi:hypothetical protein